MTRRLAAALAFLFAAPFVFAEEPEKPPERPSEELSGFLHAREDGTWLDEGDFPDPDDVATLLHLGPWISDCRVWPPHFENPDDLGKPIVVSVRPDFEPWLRGDAEIKDVPRDWVRIMATRKTGEYEGGVFHVDKILAKEQLGEKWLDAWLELDLANQDLARLLLSDPQKGRRDEIQAIVKRHLEASADERAARSAGELRDFESRIGRQWQRATAELLRRVGMGEGLPEFPTDIELADLFLKSAGKDEFHASLVKSFGGDVLLDSMRLVHNFARMAGDPVEPDLEWIALAKLFEMQDDAFLKLRDDAKTITNEQWVFQNSNVAEPAPVECQQEVKALGAVVSQVPAADCARLLIPCGGRIVSVTPGGAAETAGLKAGDILWTFDIGKAPHNPLRNDTCMVRNPGYLDQVLGSGPTADHTGWPFRYFRDGEILSAEVTK
jgi:hypothetical protein